ncbi:hypothetical protein [Flavobacterium sp. NKUCC04_CG]|uniref:hypothetical protein n=1 Tax=Flavobacterium sp. NKUCC04_CG TaxID=2842121 RepID=UPI001C5AE9C6|nr:hypothetical protein [Flavobacterium sp. NKUCC04_CG]MBW3518067.1 hypothetical protein [Flavobacterium sp. NKUCC04_CG]
MKTKEFYTVLLPLINSILTGKPFVDAKQSPIRLSRAFISSLTDSLPPSFNKHLVRCIKNYLKNLNEAEINQLSYFFVDNRQLLSVAVLIRDAECTSIQSKAYYNDELILILLDFLEHKKSDLSLHLTLYLYLENLLQIEMEKGYISIETYRKTLRFNSRIRIKDEIAFY